MIWLDGILPAARMLYSTEAALADLLPATDLLVGAVLVPGAYARTSTQALTSVTLPYLQALALGGVHEATPVHPELRLGINCLDGKLTSEEVGRAHGLH